MQASYEFEEAEGHSHYVDGRLTANMAKLDAVLSQVVTELPGV
nr:hypothetical protein [uncultured Roseovarius sp.]